MSDASQQTTPKRATLLDGILRFFLEQKLVVILLILLTVGGGIAVAPFDWEIDWMPRDPVPVDAIPNLSQNQQIVFTKWPGRSPEDVEDQVTYPLTVELMGVPGVKEVRSRSMFGFSMIFVVFEEGTEFYWSRTRILEKLNALPAGTLPEGVQPALGPDATALGQVFWYTLEGRNPDGEPVGGWDLGELRTVQDWYVRYGLLSAGGISEIASVGGYVSEYQVNVDPDALRAHDVTINEVTEAVRKSNLDIGARVTEINSVEYLVRSRGFIEKKEDLEKAVVAVRSNHAPIRVEDVATVQRGPAQRRGALAVGGAEAVGGVAVAREGANPLQAIQNVKEKMKEISPGLPAKAVIDWEKTDRETVRQFAESEGFNAFASSKVAQDAWVDWLQDKPQEQWPKWVTLSQLEIVPFYDRTNLIYRTLGTLNNALAQQILVTIVVIIALVMHLRSALGISLMLPLSVLICFVLMKLFAVEANIVALAGIAISIGTIVAMGIIVTENVLKHFRQAAPEESVREIVFRGTQEVGSAVLAAIATTVISFLPVFSMTGAEGKMFVPLAYTKTFVLAAAIFIALTIVPAVLHVLMAGRFGPKRLGRLVIFGLGIIAVLIFAVGLAQGWPAVWMAGLFLLGVAIYHLLEEEVSVWLARVAPQWAERFKRITTRLRQAAPYLASAIVAILVTWLLAGIWQPLGPDQGAIRNFLFVGILIGVLLGLLASLMRFYGRMLHWCLHHKGSFLALPAVLLVLGVTIWLGFDRVFAWIPAGVDRAGLNGDAVRQSAPYAWAEDQFPGLGREFMPDFDEGSFLWMPIISYHGSIGASLDVMKYQNKAITAIPEVKGVYGKLGRVESALDPAPVGMFETIVHYKSEYIRGEDGRRINFRYDRLKAEFVRDAEGYLIPDPSGRPYRQWRDHIESPDDIWEEITKAARIPGATSAPKLQPIETRLVMLQTGMRAPMGIKIRGPDLETLNDIALKLEEMLRQVPGIRRETVTADRVVGKPYLEITPNREAIARYGLNIADVQRVIGTAIGGRKVTRAFEGRKRFPVRVRYQRERRQDIKAIKNVLIEVSGGTQIPLEEVAKIEYRRGPQSIKSEDTFLTAYVTFAPKPGRADVDVVEEARNYLNRKIESGQLTVPEGVSWRFAGDYQNQLRATRTLSVVLPIALLAIFLILYFQFGSVSTTLNVFSGIAIAWAGGFIMLYLYGQEWFVNFELLGTNMRELFNMESFNLSVAVWVGFLSLFGIAVDSGVLVATHLDQSFARYEPNSIHQIRAVTVKASERRIRPCVMMTATTILALLPVLTATGTGADIMIPMAIPSVGGMIFVLLTLFSVPVFYSLVQELRWKRK